MIHRRARAALATCTFAALVPVLAQPAAAPVDVRISADASGSSTRVLVTAARPVAWTAAPVPGGIELSFGEPVRPDVAERTLGDPILRGWRLEGDRRVVLETGPAFSAQETFELKNPWRLVVDLTGRRPAGAVAPVPSAPSAVIVLDPGHGGVEVGAVGPTGLQEKEVVLDLARRLKARLLADDPALGVVLTRDEDRQVARDERTAIANANRAELFVSLHLNSAAAPGVSGAETYFLSADATDEDARRLAAAEDRGGRPAMVRPSGPVATDEDRALDLILWDLAQNEHVAESARLAESVQRELNVVAGTRDRGVRQAPFTVLMGATMPAILVEVGFLSNPAEEGRLRDGAHRDRLVDAIARAIAGFRQRLAQSQARASQPLTR